MTNETTRDEALSLLTEIVVVAPEIRLGQIISQLGLLAEDESGRSLSDLDDEQLLKILQRHLKELTARKPVIV